VRRVVVCSLAFVVAGAFGACGSSTELEITPYEAADASCATDAAPDVVDAPADEAAPTDAIILDMGFNGRASDAALSRCTTDQDCDGWATCQEGLCCSGTISGDICLCGEGAGCDLRHACCVPFASTTGEAECVDDCETACGCGSP
jgi:hypothetical protein